MLVRTLRSKSFIAAAVALKFLAIPFAASGNEGEALDTAEKATPKLLIEAITVVGNQSKTLQLAGSSDFLNARDLAVFDYGDVNRLLRQVPGINIQEEDGYGLRPNIGLRATGLDRSAKITLMEEVLPLRM